MVQMHLHSLPGVKIIGYDCNKRTIEELKEAGYIEIDAFEYINNYKKYNLSKKIIITFNGSELSERQRWSEVFDSTIIQVRKNEKNCNHSTWRKCNFS